MSEPDESMQGDSIARHNSQHAVDPDSYELMRPNQPARKLDLLEGLFDSEPTFWSQNGPMLTMVLLAVVVIFEVIVISCTIWLSSEDQSLSTASRTIYTTAIAMLASLISSTAIGQIRFLWLKALTAQWQREQSTVQKMQVLLQIGKLKDRGHSAPIAGALIIFGLVTTSIVGSTTVSVAPRWYSSNNFHFQGYNQEDDSFYGSDCWFSSTSGTTQDTILAWKNQSDGTFFSSNASSNMFFCPVNMQQTISLTNTLLGLKGFSPEVYGACQAAVNGYILCPALGTPVNLFNIDCNILEVFGCSLHSVTEACVPVFTSNPVTCRKIDNMTLDDQTVAAMTTDRCKISRTNTSLPFSQQDLKNLVGFCTDNHAIGDVTFLIGTTKRANIGTLAVLMDDNTHSNASSYAIECQMSLNSTLDFRTVYNSTIVPADSTRLALSINGTSEACDPDPGPSFSNSDQSGGGHRMNKDIDSILNLNARATAATFLSLAFNQSLDTVFVTSYLNNGTCLANEGEDEAEGNPYSCLETYKPLGLNWSSNALEYILGVT